MAELLLELFSEEIPSRMQRRAAEDIKAMVLKALSEQGITHKAANAYVTPRRLTLTIDGIPTLQEDTVDERRGPRVDAPDKALEGFLRSTGLTKEELEERETPKGNFYFAVIRKKGSHTADLLISILQNTLQNFTWPKSMRWGQHGIRWVRPLQNILCLFDGSVLPIEFGHLRANRTSYGHRFLANEPFEVRYFADYQENLRKHSVVVDHNERKEFICKEIDRVAAEHELKVKTDEGLLEEVTGLVEWPVVLIGSIDARFMSLPKEVLSTAMRSHQKYFSLLKHDGTVAPNFIVVSNIDTEESANHVLAGNERVLRARLSDARFFWDYDYKRPLESCLPKLDNIIFHAKLGSIGDKVKRISVLATYSAMWVPHAQLPLVERAGLLCKADLVTEMVQEFPELQGIMGSYYARKDQEHKEVEKALSEHYSPLGPDDACPSAPVSVAVALADKIDTLVGMFACDERPTGSKDPFALRRAALGVIRIICENKLHIPLKLLFEKSLNLYPSAALKSEKERASAKHKRVTAELLAFFMDRLRVSLRSEGIRHDVVTAVCADEDQDDLYALVVRAHALQEFVGTDASQGVLAACKRAVHILAIEEKKDKTTYSKAPQEGKLQEYEEKQLFKVVFELKSAMKSAVSNNHVDSALELLLQLQEPLEQFFDHVTVNCNEKDIRRNRLCLLAQVRALFNMVATVEHLEG